MDVSIVIVNFNTFHLVKDCISSIVKYTSGLSYEIIVVDNSMNPSEEENFIEILPKIIYINPKQNLGFGMANNLGFSLAKGKYILALNSDSLLIENSIKDCLDFIQSSFSTEKNIGMIGCKLLNEDLTFQHSFFPFKNNTVWTYFKCSNPILYRLFRIDKKYKEPEQYPIEVGDISGAYMFFDKNIIETTKGFDANFFMYCEETEWCRERIRKAYKIYYLPSTSVIHLGGKSAPKKLMFLQNILSVSLLWYKKGIFNYLSYIILTYTNVVIYSLIYPLVGQEQRRFSKSYIKAYIKIFFYHFYQIPKAVKTKNPLIYTPLNNLFFKKA